MYYTSTKYFKYENLEPDIIKAFLSANEINSVDKDGKETYYSFNGLCKFKEAILFGAKRVKKMLSEKYRVDMASFIDYWKKEN